MILGYLINLLIFNREKYMPTNKNNITDADANAMGRELIFKIAANNFTAFETLIEKGANVNFCDKDTGNTLLHFLYYYGKCAVEYLELLLENAAKITANKEGLLPIDLAEKSCNATEFQTIKDLFESYNTQSKPSKIGLIPYHQQKLAMTIGMPTLALLSGVFAGGWEEVAQRNKKHYAYLPYVIFGGLQPISLAMLSAGMNSLLVGSAVSVDIEDAGLSFAFYLGINYFGLMFAQLGEKFTKKIQNKVLNLLISILLYIFYLNPSLIIKLLSEGFKGVGFQAELMPLLATLSSGGLFKFGEFGSKKAISKFFQVNSNNNQEANLPVSLDGEQKEISDIQDTISKIKVLFESFKRTLNMHISKDASALIDEKIKLAKDNLSELFNKQNNELDRNIFYDFEKNLTAIRDDLGVLKNMPKAKHHIEYLYDQITKIFPYVSGIRPLPESSSVDMSANLNNGTDLTLKEENIPLMTFNGMSNHLYDNNETSHYQVPTKNPRRISFEDDYDFPPPPPEHGLPEWRGEEQSHQNDRSMRPK